MPRLSAFSLTNLCALFAAVLVAAPATAQSTIPLTATGTAYTQDFNSLASSGSPASTLPQGWQFNETLANANALYSIGNGSSNGGDTYSFGPTNSTNRAFGTLLSGNLKSTIGACFLNNTGAAITSLSISYTGEQWRLGAVHAQPDRLSFEYAVGTTSVASGTYTPVPALDFSSPLNAGTVGALDGTSAANQRMVAASVDGLNIAASQSFCIHWLDVDATPGADDGLAIDDFSLTPQSGSSSLAPTGSGSAAPSTLSPGDSTTFTAVVTPGSSGAAISVTCNLAAIGGSTGFSLPNTSGTTYSAAYVVPVGTAANTYSLPCTVSDGQLSSAFSLALAVNGTAGPPPSLRKIYEITGSGVTSPLAGTAVTVRGVITAVRGTTGSTKGFYLESLPADRDSNPSTSEGVLVFIGSTALPSCAVAGNYVQIDGTVADFVPSSAPLGAVPLTELGAASNCQVLGTNALSQLPAAVTLDTNTLVPGGDANQSRRFLSMRVMLTNAITTGPSLGNLNETTATASPSGDFFVTLQGVGRPFRGAGILATERPNDAPATVPTWNGDPAVLRIDPTGLTGGITFEVSTGTTVSSINGIMDLDTSEGQYQIYTNAAGIGTLNPPSPTLAAIPIPDPLPTDLLVVNANLERFFNASNDGNGNSVILTASAYQGRLNKLSLAIRNVLHLPDILTLEEVEGPGPNDPQVYPVPQDIVNKVNADAVAAGLSNPNYTWCQYPTNDIGQISASIIYRQDRVTLLECKEYGLGTQYNTPGGGTALLNDRPPTVLLATVKAPGSDSGLTIRVVGNHLRSLNGIDEPGVANGDRVRAKRNEQAKYVAALVTGNLPEQTQNWNVTDNLLVAGDLNAFDVNDGYVDVVNCIAGSPAPANQQYFTAAELAVSAPCTAVPTLSLHNLTTPDPAQRYSYDFSGIAQRLDHILVDDRLFSRVRQFAYGRNNADFPEGPTYRNNVNRSERYSDHDMPAVYFSLPVEVTSRSQVNASPLVWMRAAGRYNGTISVTNTGTAALTGPVYVFFNNLPANVTLPDLPKQNGVPYATITIPGGLMPGATSGAVMISFANPSNGRISYNTQRFDGSF